MRGNLLIKKNVFEKNRSNHKDLSIEDSRSILTKVFEKQGAIINDKPGAKPNYWIVANIDGRYALANLDTDPAKTHIEFVGWRWSTPDDLERIKERAIKDGGQIIITNSGAADLSALHDALDNKGKDLSEENNTLLSKIDNIDRAIASVTGRDVNDVHTERVRHELAKNQEFVNLVKAPSELAKENFKYSKVKANQQIFVSNAERAVESLNMGKASGEQWLKAIQGKGGLKAGEDKWLGLSDWLAEQKKPVTREELLK